MMYIDTTIGITAGCLNMVGFIMYNKQIFNGKSKPNSATWILWVFLSVLNLVSYIGMSRDLIKSAVSIAGTIPVVITFLIIWFHGKFSKLDYYDLSALIVGIMATVVWWEYKSAKYANIIIQLSFVISLIPTYKNVWQNRQNEKSSPWFIWTSSYALIMIVVYMRYKGQWEEFIYPTNGFLLHLGVGLLAGGFVELGGRRNIDK